MDYSIIYLNKSYISARLAESIQLACLQGRSHVGLAWCTGTRVKNTAHECAPGMLAVANLGF
jgi:hypothetical protein